MFHEMTRWQSRALALLILLLLISGLVAAVVIPAWSTNAHFKQTLTQIESRLEILKRSAGIGASLKAEFEQLKRLQATDVHYLKSKSDALGAAELQRIVKQVVTPKGGDIISTQILPPKQQQGTTRVTLRVRMKGSLEMLVSVFHTLETGNPYLFLDNVSLRGRSVARRRVARVNPVTGISAPTLDIDFELSGYMRGTES
mgnify:FL=1